MIVDILVLALVGLVVGALARAVLPGDQGLPIWLTLLIGVGSLLLAGLIFDSLLVKVIVGTIIAAVIMAVAQGGVRAKSHS